MNQKLPKPTQAPPLVSVTALLRVDQVETLRERRIKISTILRDLLDAYLDQTSAVEAK